MTEGPTEPAFGPESQRLDAHLAARIDPPTRTEIWSAARSILAEGPSPTGDPAARTGLALGYVQSGKTTSITALIAAASDEGYRVVIALLGSTNLLLDQNKLRLEAALGIGQREDYLWVVEPNPTGTGAAKRAADWLDRGRTVLIPVLKHAGRIRSLAGVLGRLDLAGVRALVIDDEADQASLNTLGVNAESRTYESIREMRGALPRHLYVQYTATPYVPLLLEADDLLLPEFVEFLHPGPGYVGGREFFVDFADKVVRDVPSLEEQATKNLPLMLPGSLVTALGSFIAGAALLLRSDPLGAPVSMLVHSTQRNDVQARYHFLLERQLAAWRLVAGGAADASTLPPEVQEERQRLVSLGAPDVAGAEFLDQVRLVLREATLWLVNSVSALNKVDWKVAPIHILVGGNKLDRGYTIEGLTVTYMNRPTSIQVDTMEQRARAFGYRQDQLPYCQFFATKRTVKVLRDTVFTEYDLRAELQDHIADGGSVGSWAREIGLLLPEGTKPTRDAVVQALSKEVGGWHSLRKPAIDEASRSHNEALVRATGLFDAPPVDYGRLRHRTLTLPMEQVIEDLLAQWVISGYSPGWRHEDILQALGRSPERDAGVEVLLMEDAGGARTRKWDPDLGFVNLFQGKDVKHEPGTPFYPGDLAVPGIASWPDRIALQMHRVVRRDASDQFDLLTPAIYLGSRSIVRKT